MAKVNNKKGDEMRVLLLCWMLMQGGVLMAKNVWKGSAILIIKKENLDDFKKAVGKIIIPTKKEKGCLHYEGYQVVDEQGKATNRFEFHEIWETKEAMLVDHKEKSQHMKNFFKEIKADTSESYLESFIVDGKYVNVLEGVI